jgi:hypothetical protein
MNFNFLNIFEILNLPVDLNCEGVKVEKSELEGQFDLILLQVLSNILNAPTTLKQEASTLSEKTKETTSAQFENSDGQVKNSSEISILSNVENAQLPKIDLGLLTLEIKTLPDGERFEEAGARADFKFVNLKSFNSHPLVHFTNVKLKGSSSEVEVLKSLTSSQVASHLNLDSEIVPVKGEFFIKFAQYENELSKQTRGDGKVQVARVSEKESGQFDVKAGIKLSDIGFETMRKLTEEVGFEFKFNKFEKTQEIKIDVGKTDANSQIKNERIKSNHQGLFFGEYEKFKNEFEVSSGRLNSQAKFVLKDFVSDGLKIMKSSDGEKFQVVYEGVKIQDVVDRVREFALSGKNLQRGEIVLKLEPKELGEVVVKISQGDKGVSVLFEVKNFEIKQVIESRIDSLKMMLESSDVKLERVGVMFDGLNSGDGRREGFFKKGNTRRKEFDHVGLVKIYGSSSIEAII